MKQHKMMKCRLLGRHLLGSALAGLMIAGFSPQAIGEEKKEDAWEAYMLAIEETKEGGSSDPTNLEKSGIRLLQPKLRVFFDTGTDDPGEVDIFSDGELGISLEFVEFYKQWNFFGHPEVYHGISLAGGITSTSATDSSTVLVLSGAYYVGTDIMINDKPVPIGMEVGIMHGISADESLSGGDRDDTAIFVGVKIGNGLIDSGDKD